MKGLWDCHDSQYTTINQAFKKIRQMKQTEKKLVPALRFPEFEGEWVKLSFNEVVKINPKSSLLPNSFIYIDLESVNNGVLLKEERIHKEDAPSRAQRLLIYKDILYQTVRPYQKNNLHFTKSDVDYVASTGYAQLRTKENSNFVFQYIHTGYFVKKVLLRCTGTSYPAINSSDLGKINISIPSLPEQQKIASFLTAIDKRIQALEKKKSLLEQYKKGVMQGLFRRNHDSKDVHDDQDFTNSKNQGHQDNQEKSRFRQLRFKDENGQDFPAWEEKKLGEVFKRSTIKNLSNSISFVLTNSASEGITSQSDYFERDIANKNNLYGYYIVEINDFIYNPRISNLAPVGPLQRNKLKLGVMSPLYTVLKHRKGNIDFFELYFKSTAWHKYMKSIANYGARHDRMNITIKDFENMPIPYPTVKEQTRIANYLTALDKKIAGVDQQIEKTKAYKQGLLQKMFV